MYIRENIRNIESDPNKINSLRSAFNKIIPRVDNQGFAAVASHHGWLDGLCPHGPERDPSGNIYHDFLPWHRAYLLKLERLLQQQESNVSIPWWDWRTEQTMREGIPRSISQLNINREPNPLNRFRMVLRGRSRNGAPVNINRFTTMRPRRPSEIRSTQRDFALNEIDIPDLYRINDFRQFSESLRVGWHNFIHNWIGGDMGSVDTAAYVPIFYFHHCNVDRIFAIWQTIHGTDSIPSHMLDRVLQPFRMTVREVLDINSLEYEYASSSN